MPGWLTAFLGIIANALGIVTGSQRRAQQAVDQKSGIAIQTGADATARADAESKMAEALAKSPRDKDDLDDRLKNGDY